MATLDAFRRIEVAVDTANDWMPDIRLSAGDESGRVLRAVVTDDGVPITSTNGLSATLQYNPQPGAGLGYEVAMTPVSGEATATFDVTIPRRAIMTPGVTGMAVKLSRSGMAVCTRSFNALVERAVYDPTSPDAQDKLDEIRQAIADLNAANKRANDLLGSLSISIGTVTTLPPTSKATASFTGSTLSRILNLGIPKGHDGANASANGGIVVQDTTPEKPVQGQIWLRTDDEHMRITDCQRWDGSKWIAYTFASLPSRQWSVLMSDGSIAWFKRTGWWVTVTVTFHAFTGSSIQSPVIDSLLQPATQGAASCGMIGPAMVTSLPLLDATVGPTMLLQVTDRLTISRTDTKTAMPVLTGNKLYVLRYTYLAAQELLPNDAKPAYWTRTNPTTNNGAVLADFYTYKDPSGASVLATLND